MPSCLATLVRGDRNDGISYFGVSWSVGPLIKFLCLWIILLDRKWIL